MSEVYFESPQSREDADRERWAERAVDQGVVSYYGAQIASSGFYPEKIETEHDDPSLELNGYNPYDLSPEELEAWRSMNQEAARASARIRDARDLEKIKAIADPVARAVAHRLHIAVQAKKRQQS